MDRESGALACPRDRQQLGMISGDLVDEVAKILAPRGSVERRRGDQVAAVDPGEMHDLVAVRATECEPGLALVAQALLAGDPQAGTHERGLDAVELRKFLLRPAYPARRSAWKQRDDGTHRDLTALLDTMPGSYRSWKARPKASKKGARR